MKQVSKSNQKKDLLKGNKLFQNRKDGNGTRRYAPELATGQAPGTIVITCADSRVPPELIFNKDLGELFVIRLAGNVPTDEAIASAEYAAANLGSSLLIVMGHTKCGAIQATYDTVVNNTQLPSPSLKKLVAQIKPAIRDRKGQASLAVTEAIHKNVELGLDTIREKSPILAGLEKDGRLEMIGAIYELETGKVRLKDLTSHSASPPSKNEVMRESA